MTCQKIRATLRLAYYSLYIIMVTSYCDIDLLHENMDVIKNSAEIVL